MRNPYVQVAMTYIRHPFSSVLRCIITLYLLVTFGGTCAILGRDGNHQKLNLFHVMLFAVLFAYWGIHAKEQFADCRASLTPGFRRVHSIVAAAMAFLLAVVFPVGIASWMGWDPLGLLALTTLLFGAMVWFVLLPNGWLSALIIAGNLSILAEPVRGGLDELVHGHFEAQAFAMMILGAAISLWGGIRLALLNEDMPEYHLRFQINMPGKIQMSGQQQLAFDKALSRGLKGWLFERSMQRMIRHARRAFKSRWSRVCRWRMMPVTGISIPLMAIGVYLYLLLVTWMLGKDLPIVMFISFISFVPICVVWGAFGFGKMRFQSHELMMPVTREAYFKQQGMAAAIGLFQVWIAVIAALVLCVLTTAKDPRPWLVVDAVALSALSQIWLFGLAVWVLRFRSFSLSLVGIFFAAFSVTIPASILEEPMLMNQWRPYMLPFGAVLAIFGLLLTWRAYRRWLVADFD